MVVVGDDEDRENEGDLIMAAELVKPSDINFMVTHARGLVCLSLTRERCAQLGLPPMVRDNTSSHHTNFTVSIEAEIGRHTSELQSLMRISYAVFCLKKNKQMNGNNNIIYTIHQL